MRDFVNSRVIGGKQQIGTHVSFHTNGKLVLWPYGYTRTNVPGDMNELRAIGSFTTRTLNP